MVKAIDTGSPTKDTELGGMSVRKGVRSLLDHGVATPEKVSDRLADAEAVIGPARAAANRTPPRHASLDI